jgi:hypothetical protein
MSKTSAGESWNKRSRAHHTFKNKIVFVPLKIAQKLSVLLEKGFYPFFTWFSSRFPLGRGLKIEFGQTHDW